MPSPIVYLAHETLPPFEYVDGGEVRGFNVELLNEISRETGRRIEVRAMPWPQVIAALEAGQPVLASLAFTPDRDRRFDLLTSTTTVRLSVFLPASPGAVRLSLADLDGLTIAVEHGTMALDVLRAQPGLKGVTLLQTPDKFRAIDEVIAGRADGIAGSSATVRWAASQRRIGLPVELPVSALPLFLATSRGCGTAFEPIVAAVQRLHASGRVDELAMSWLRSQSALDSTTWRLIRAAAFALTCVIGIILAWNVALRRRVADRTRELRAALSEQTHLTRRAITSETRLAGALDAIDEGVWEWASDGRTERLWVSGRWSKLLGFASEDLPADIAAWLECVHPDDRSRIEAAHERAVKEPPGLFDERYRMRKRDGAYTWFHDRGRIVERDARGAPRRMVGIVRDVTAEHAAEEAMRQARDAAEEAARSKSTFLTTMSHEIRTPLNAVIGVSGLLDATPLDEDQRRLVGVVQTSAQALLALVDDVLDFSKLEAGRVEVDARAFEPRILVDTVVRVVTAASTERRVDLSHQVDPSVPAWLRGDDTRLKQILLNLVSNAVKFTPPGGEVRLDVRLDATGPAGGVLVCRVRDSGIGIPADRLSRLFQPFSQADSSTTREYGGTGLGLAISQRLAVLLGGAISVESQPGVGSAFTLRVPAAEADAPASPRPRLAAGSRAALRILLAEDNPINQFVERRVLQQLGCACDVVANGREAVEALARSAYDVVLLDVQMPVMDGPAAAAEIRRRGLPAGRLVALTADVTEDTRDACLAAGIDAYLTKPLHADRLAALLDSVTPSLGKTA
ncbi:MAG: ATP-binding protein [Vicinamibacterales bacterium]